MRAEFTHCTQVETVRDTRCRCWEIQSGSRSPRMGVGYLPQRHKAAKKDAKKLMRSSLCVFLCAFAPLREKTFLDANPRHPQAINPRAMGDRVGRDFVPDRRVGRPGFRWYQQSHLRDSRRNGVVADDRLSPGLRRDTPRYRNPHRQLLRCRKAPVTTHRARDRVDYLFLWL